MIFEALFCHLNLKKTTTKKTTTFKCGSNPDGKHTWSVCVLTKPGNHNSLLGYCRHHISSNVSFVYKMTKRHLTDYLHMPKRNKQEIIYISCVDLYSYLGFPKPFSHPGNGFNQQNLSCTTRKKKKQQN